MSADNLPRNADGTLTTFAWPGGYPVIYIDQGEVLCSVCANDYKPALLAAGIHWEGQPETCADCNAEIESAYGDPDETA